MIGSAGLAHRAPTLVAHAITAFGGEAAEAQLCIFLGAAFGFPMGEITSVVGDVLRADPLFASSRRQGEVLWSIVEQELGGVSRAGCGESQSQPWLSFAGLHDG